MFLLYATAHYQCTSRQQNNLTVTDECRKAKVVTPKLKMPQQKTVNNKIMPLLALLENFCDHL